MHGHARNGVDIQTEAPGGKHPLARRDYVLHAPWQRVWDLLASTIIQCMPVEQMEIVDDSTFHAVLKVKIGFVEVPFQLKVRAAEIDPIASLGTLVTVRGGFSPRSRYGIFFRNSTRIEPRSPAPPPRKEAAA